MAKVKKKVAKAVDDGSEMKVGKSGVLERPAKAGELREIKRFPGKAGKEDRVELYPDHVHHFGRVIANPRDLPKRAVCTFTDKDGAGACGYEQPLPKGSTVGTPDPDDEVEVDEDDEEAEG